MSSRLESGVGRGDMDAKDYRTKPAETRRRPKVERRLAAVLAADMLRNFEPLNQITTIVRPAPLVRLPTGKDAVPRISGATAEWVMERPRPLVLGSGNLEPFPDYGSVEFSSCVAGTAPRAGLPTSEEVLRGPLLRMFEVPGDAPSRTRTLSTPRRIGTTSFGIDYGGLKPP